MVDDAVSAESNYDIEAIGCRLCREFANLIVADRPGGFDFL